MICRPLNLFKNFNYLRAYCSYGKPIQMAYNVFETENTQKSKPPLMIMHGLFGSKQNWRNVCRALALNTNRKANTHYNFLFL